MIIKSILTEHELFCDPLINSDKMKRSAKEWEKIIKKSNIEESISNYFNRNPNEFLNLLKDGPPPKYRWVAWKTVLQINSLLSKNTYQSLISSSRRSEAKWAKSIEADIHRTFPDKLAKLEPNVKELIIQKLENVLIAISLYCPEIGYCQGINYVVGFMLFVSDLKDEEVFWTFIALVKNKLEHDALKISGIEGLYSERFPKLEFLLRCFSMAFTQEEPLLKQQFDTIEFANIIWVHKWMFVMFLLSFKLCYCLRFWDYIFGEGISGMIKLSLAIVKVTKEKYEGKTFTGCNDVMNSFKEGKNLPDVEEIIDVADSIKLSEDVIPNEEGEMLGIGSEMEEAKAQSTYNFKATKFILV